MFVLFGKFDLGKKSDAILFGNIIYYIQELQCSIKDWILLVLFDFYQELICFRTFSENFLSTSSNCQVINERSFIFSWIFNMIVILN